MKPLTTYRAFAVIVICILLSHVGLAQSYLGQTTKQVNLREGPGTDYEVLRSLPQGSQLFVVIDEVENDFYPVVDIGSNVEGYVHRSFVKLIRILEENREGVFTPTGKTSGILAELEIYNRTELILTLKMGEETYMFKPYERTTLSVQPRKYSYRASAPGVLPDFGSETVDSGTSYSWEFYIITR
jgi:hypothetical protein